MNAVASRVMKLAAIRRVLAVARDGLDSERPLMPEALTFDDQIPRAQLMRRNLCRDEPLRHLHFLSIKVITRALYAE